MNPCVILSLFGIYTYNFNVDPTIQHDKFCNYHELAIVEDNLKYIIQKCKASDNDLVNRIGETLENFYFELCNTLSIKNKFRITNAVAEGNNSIIDKLIKLSFGMRNFRLFRKRIMHIK